MPRVQSMNDPIRDKLWADEFLRAKAENKFACNPKHEADMAVRDYDARAAQPSQPATVVPVAEIVTFGGLDGQKEVSWSKGKMPPLGTKLYAHPSAPAESGWQWVPVEPTLAMLDIAQAPNGYTMDGYPNPCTNAERYRSMLKAAPSAAQPGGEGGA